EPNSLEYLRKGIVLQFGPELLSHGVIGVAAPVKFDLPVRVSDLVSESSPPTVRLEDVEDTEVALEGAPQQWAAVLGCPLGHENGNAIEGLDDVPDEHQDRGVRVAGISGRSVLGCLEC